MHRSILTPLVILFLFTVTGTAQVLDDEAKLWKQAQFHKENKEFLAYYKTLEELEDYYVKTVKDSECLHLLDDQYNLLPTTTLDTFNFRKYVGYHAFYLKKYCGDLNGARDFYELAFKYNRSPTELGMRCWLLEKHLATIYAQLNDREREVYYLNLVEKKISELKDTSKLLRLYADLGAGYLALSDTSTAMSIWDNAFESAHKGNYNKSVHGIGLHLLTISSESKFDLETINKRIKLALDRLNNDRRFEKSEYYERMGQYFETNAEINFSNDEFDLAITNYRKAFEYFDKYYNTPSRELAKLYLKIALAYKEKNEFEKAKEMLQVALNQLIPDALITDPNIKEKLWAENAFASIFETYSDCLINQERTIKVIMESKRYLDLSIDINQALHDEILLSQDRYISLVYHKTLVSKSFDLCRYFYEKGNEEEAKKWGVELFKISKNQEIRKEILRTYKIQQLAAIVQDSVKKIKKELQAIVNKESIIGNRKYLALNQRLVDLYNTEIKTNKKDRKESASSIEYAICPKYVYINYQQGSINYFTWADRDSVEFYADKILLQLDKLVDEKLIIENLQELSNLILPPFDIENEIVFIPDGFLQSFPYDLLIINNEYLFKSCAIRISIGEINSKNSSAAKKEKDISFIEGKYSQENSTDSYTYASKRSEPSSLRFTDKEILAIEQVLNTNQSQRFTNLSFEDALSKSANSNILHYSGHAKAHENRAFIIHGSNDSLEFIYEEEIALIDQHFDLVTLSACETGLGQFKPGDGMKNLCNAFLKSGSKSVVYSNWLVDDYSTSELMALFYKHIANGMKKSAALRHAKLDYLQEASPLKKHPYYWASFSITGNDEPLQITKTKPNKYLIFGVGMLFLAGLFIYSKRTRK